MSVYASSSRTATNPQFGIAQNDPFGILNLEYYFLPAFGDLDDDGDFDILVADYMNNKGVTKYFENTGTAANPQFASPISPAFGITPVG